MKKNINCVMAAPSVSAAQVYSHRVQAVTTTPQAPMPTLRPLILRWEPTFGELFVEWGICGHIEIGTDIRF